MAGPLPYSGADGRPVRLAWRLVAVGSGNPPKLAAARSVFAELAPEARVVGVAVASGVSTQPLGDEETRRGARLRAERARDASGADLGVGMESGVAWLDGEAWGVNWCAVAGANGRMGFGRGIGILLPPAVAARVREGALQGEAMDRLTGRHRVAEAEGTVGVLTGGLLDRAAMWRGALAVALAPFLHPALYP